jgi:hypothetical protein
VDCTLSCLEVLPSQEGENVSNSSDNLDTSGERGRIVDMSENGTEAKRLDSGNAMDHRAAKEKL